MTAGRTIAQRAAVPRRTAVGRIAGQRRPRSDVHLPGCPVDSDTQPTSQTHDQINSGQLKTQFNNIRR